jgi:HemY protein
MYRIILFLALIALAAAGAAWIADQTGDVALSWGSWRVQTSLPVFALALGIAVVAVMVAWTILRALWRMPERLRRSRRERRLARGRHAITRSSTATAKPPKPRSAPWPNARTRGYWACAVCSSKRSAPTMPYRR